MDKKKLISILAIFACFFGLGVVALGAFTRLIDAGLGCPDWPGCYGHLVVPVASYVVAYKAWAEMIHRYFAGSLSVLIIALISLVFFCKIIRTRSNLVLAFLLLFLILYQIILGQMTVTLKLLPIIVTQHLLGGFLIVTSLWLIYLKNAQQYEQPILSDSTTKSIKSIFPWVIVGCIMLIGQIFLGAWTSTNYASLSCPDFPFCLNTHPGMVMHYRDAFNIFKPVGINYEGGVLSVPARQTIQMVHRIGALVVVLYFFGLFAYSLQKLLVVPSIVRQWYVILVLLCIQVCIGISNVIFKLPLITAVAHNLIALLLLLSVVTLLFKLLEAIKR